MYKLQHIFNYNENNLLFDKNCYNYKYKCTENGKKKNMQKPLKNTTNPLPIHKIHILK
jgi:hypothetical protein